MFSVHQCEKYYNNLKLFNEKSVKWEKYLEKKNTNGMTLHPEPNRQLNSYVDAWHQDYIDMR